MQRIYLLSITLLCSLYMLGQSPAIGQLFMSVPAEYLWLTQADRSSLLVNYNEKNIDTIQNSLSGTSRILILDDTTKHLLIETSSKGRFELQLLNNDGQPCYAIIRTTCAPACDSRIECFDTHWNRLPIDPPALKPEDFLLPTVSGEDKALAVQLLTPLFVSLSFDKKGFLDATCNAKQFLSDDNWKKLNPLLPPQALNFTLQNGRWVKTSDTK